MIYWVIQIGKEPPELKQLEIWELLNKLNYLELHKNSVRYWIETRK